MFENKIVLITGGTGSLGRALTEKLLKLDVAAIRIYSRHEWEQIQMERQLKDRRLRFLIGDVRDKDRLKRAVEGVDIVFHAAALKQIPSIEYNPFEAVKTNVYGSQNVIDICMDEEVEKVIAISSDKACSPLNTYGATKLLMEKLVVAANFYKGKRKTVFSCVRYGNVLGSKGSVIPVWKRQIKDGIITITDQSMTRFNIIMREALEFVLLATSIARGAEVFVPKLKAYIVEDLADAFIEVCGQRVKKRVVGLRAGEKMHESLLNKEEMMNIFETPRFYILTPSSWLLKKFMVSDWNGNLKIEKTNRSEQYTSETAPKLSRKELKKMLVEECF